MCVSLLRALFIQSWTSLILLKPFDFFFSIRTACSLFKDVFQSISCSNQQTLLNYCRHHNLQQEEDAPNYIRSHYWKQLLTDCIKVKSLMFHCLRWTLSRRLDMKLTDIYWIWCLMQEQNELKTKCELA